VKRDIKRERAPEAKLHGHPIQFVILSGAGTSRSEASAESKDPYTLGKDAWGILPFFRRRLGGQGVAYLRPLEVTSKKAPRARKATEEPLGGTEIDEPF